MYSLNLVLDQSSRVIALRESLTIGRHSLCKLHLSYEFISRWQCVLILMPPDGGCDRPYFKIKDGELQGSASRNGTWVNGNRITLQQLHHQDVITFSQSSSFPRIEFLDIHATLAPEIGTDSYEFESV